MRSEGRLAGARLSLAKRFMLASLAILLIGMAGIGAWVTRQIEDGVVQRTAATTALYVDSLIASPVQGLADGGALAPEDAAELDRLLRETPLGQQLAVFRVWDRTGRVVYSTVPELVGQRIPVAGELASALRGWVAADVGELEGDGEVPAGVPRDDLLEIHSPVRSRGTDEVIAAAEFYYGTDDLRGEIAAAQRRSWLVVGGATVLIYLLLAAFVQRASNTIAGQQRAMADQVERLTELLRQNQELHERVRGAAARTTALNERFLRRFSAELHDGPAQDIGLALLWLDHVAAQCGPDGVGPEARPEAARNLDLIQESLRRALQEVRGTSSELLLPELGALSVAETVERAVRSHRRRSGTAVDVALGELPEQASLAVKIALYRIV
ncbi:MAG: histidine kinase [Chloroflexota bacterium]|nr:histidine kinase [Chloroflexota bacterium]